MAATTKKFTKFSVDLVVSILTDE